jgi:hypothetical protein
MHNEELHNFNSSPYVTRMIISRETRWVGYVGHLEGVRTVYKVLFGKPEGKRPLERLRHRWEDNIRMNYKEIG